MAAPSDSIFLTVMAGGSGTRFWPKSTSRRPKQLLKFGGVRSLLCQTLDRFESVPQKWILTTKSLEKVIQEDVQGKARVLAEPEGRNTAPCLYWAAKEIQTTNPNAIMIVMPSDHFVRDLPAFQTTLKKAIAWAQTHEDLVTLGVKPTRPETGYGYLKTGAKKDGCLVVEKFVEKPNAEKAQEFLKSGNYLWNGGMFIWKVSVLLKAFDAFLPEYARTWDESQGRVDMAYPKLQATSIDYGIMEKAKNVVTFELECGWDDVGSWTSLESIADDLHLQTDSGVVMSGDVIGIESRGNIIDVAGKKVALLGVNDLIIVQSGDCLLIADKSKAQDIRKIVDEVKKQHPQFA